MDKDLKKKLIIVTVLALAVMAITGVVQMWMEVPRVQQRELSQCQLKLDAVAEVVHSVEETRKASKASFEEHLHENIRLMISSLAEEVTADGYTGPELFEDGAVVLLRNGKGIWPEGAPQGFPELTAEQLQSDQIVEADVTDNTAKDPGTEAATKRMVFLAGKIAGDYYYVDWTDEEEILTSQYACLQDEEFLKVAEESFGGMLLFVSASDPTLPFLRESASWPDANNAVELGFTPEILAQKQAIVTVKGTRSLCCYAEVDGGEAMLIYVKPAHEMYMCAALHVGMIQISCMIILATLITYIFSVRKYVMTRKCSRVLLRRYQPKTFRRIIFAAGLTGAVAIFLITGQFQMLDVLHEDSIQGAKSINRLFEYLQDSTTERLEYDKKQEAEWDVYQGHRIAELIFRRPETATREKLQEYCDILSIDYIMLFDSEGRETVTNSDYTGFTMDAGLGENSADFKRLLKGVPSVVHEASTDSVTGLKRQMIGVKIPGAAGSGEAPHGALIMAIQPKNTLKSNEELSRQLQFINNGDRLCFFTDPETGVIQYASDTSLIGKKVTECGLPDKSLEAGYTDFTSLNGRASYVTVVKQASVNFYYVLSTSSLFSDTLESSTIGVIAFLITFILVVAIGLHGYTTEKFKKWTGDALHKADEDDVQETTQRQSYSELLVSSSLTKEKMAARTPETRAGVILKLDILLLVVVPAMFFLLGDQSAGGTSLISYILYGDWMRGLSLFAISGILTIVTAGLLILLVCNLLLSLIAGFTGRGWETLCRLLYSLARYVTVLAILYYVFEYLGLSLSTYVASLGTVSLALSIGSRDMVADIVAGIMILFERQFQVGDIVELDGCRGQVLEMGVRSTKLLCPGDDIRYVSNSNIRSVINKTKRLSFFSQELTVVTQEPLEKVEELFNRELPEIAKKKRQIKELTLGGISRVTGGGQPDRDKCVSVKIKWTCQEGDQEDMRDFINREVYLLCEREHIEIR